MLRHVLPGTLIAGGYFIHRPEAFPWLIGDLNTQRLIVLSVMCIAIGNFFYVINRYLVLGSLEWLFFWRRKGWIARLVAWLLQDYATLVGKEILLYNGYGSNDEKLPTTRKSRKFSFEALGRLIKWRDSAAVYLLVGGQAAFIAAFDTHEVLAFWKRPACGHEISMAWMLVFTISSLCGVALYALNRFIVRECIGRELPSLAPVNDENKPKAAEPKSS